MSADSAENDSETEISVIRTSETAVMPLCTKVYDDITCLIRCAYSVI